MNKSDIVKDFLNIYGTLTTLQQKIFRFLQKFARKWRNVFTSIETIAKYTKCHKSSVSRCTTYFEKCGFLIKKRRGYCSNNYFISDELIDLNLNDKASLSREKKQIDASVLDKPLICNDNSRVKSSFKENISKPVPVPKCINIQGISFEDQQRLAKRFGEHVLIKAIEYAKYLSKKGERFKSLMAFVWNRAETYSRIKNI